MNFVSIYNQIGERMATHSVLLPGKSHGWRNLVGCSPWGCNESDTTERLHFHFSLSCIGEGNSNPLQCSCLENPRDGGAWWAAIYGVTQSSTRLKWLSSSSSITKLLNVRKGLWGPMVCSQLRSVGTWRPASKVGTTLWALNQWGLYWLWVVGVRNELKCRTPLVSAENGSTSWSGKATQLVTEVFQESEFSNLRLIQSCPARLVRLLKRTCCGTWPGSLTGAHMGPYLGLDSLCTHNSASFTPHCLLCTPSRLPGLSAFLPNLQK